MRAGERLLAVAVDEGRFRIEALAVGRAQELEVEVGALAPSSVLDLGADRAADLDDRRAEAR